MVHERFFSDVPSWLLKLVRRYRWLAFLLPLLESLTVKSLGVVYGDIGTSPIYAENVAFGLLKHTPSDAEVIGIVSTIIWSLVLVPFLWYTIILMRTAYRGEGGITALMSYTIKVAPFFVTIIGVIGVAALFSDGMITPAISVLSAIEGLRNLQPGLPTIVIVGITLVILLALFSIQYRGTGFVGILFGPIMILWFSTLAITGLIAILYEPRILMALDPRNAIWFVTNHKLIGGTLNGIVLVITGGEALYADLGHFGKWPIRKAWIRLVMPALILQYMGQGAMVLHDKSNASKTLFALVPHFLFAPMVILTTVATIIASQALITGVFSLVKSLSCLHLVPKMVLRSTSRVHHGQIYYGIVNWTLAAGSLSMVVAFQTSNNLANAYGLAVMITMLSTIVERVSYSIYVVEWKVKIFLWLKAAIVVVGFGLTIGAVVGVYFIANLAKISEGGQTPITMTLIFTALMLWNYRRETGVKVRKEAQSPTRSLSETIQMIQSQNRVVHIYIDLPFHQGTMCQIAEGMLHNGKVHKLIHVDCEMNEEGVKAVLERNGIYTGDIEVVVLCSPSGDIAQAVQDLLQEDLKHYNSVHAVLSQTIFNGSRLHGLDHQVGDSLFELFERTYGVTLSYIPHRTEYLLLPKRENDKNGDDSSNPVKSELITLEHSKYNV